MSDTIEHDADSQNLPKKINFKKEILGWLEALVGAVVIVGLITTFVGRSILVSGSSMTNTLMDQDRIIITPLYTELKHNDIVVVRRQGDKPLIKRVIAIAGDTLDIDWVTGEVLINGEAVDEPFIREKMELPVYAFDMTELPVTVPKEYIFVMGDNRNDSADSRLKSIGLIDTQNVMGKAVFRIWPSDKIGLLEDYTY